MKDLYDTFVSKLSEYSIPVRIIAIGRSALP